MTSPANLFAHHTRHTKLTKWMGIGDRKISLEPVSRATWSKLLTSLARFPGSFCSRKGKVKWLSATLSSLDRPEDCLDSTSASAQISGEGMQRSRNFGSEDGLKEKVIEDLSWMLQSEPNPHTPSAHDLHRCARLAFKWMKQAEVSATSSKFTKNLKAAFANSDCLLQGWSDEAMLSHHPTTSGEMVDQGKQDCMVGRFSRSAKMPSCFVSPNSKRCWVFCKASS
mmetsp:Transcript_67736/g.170878  ORF Transcript_67736/g.170878 Transcript_67736/m.170878 type:complete len:225 (-) Transcript_67736:523-1197(-)